MPGCCNWRAARSHFCWRCSRRAEEFSGSLQIRHNGALHSQNVERPVVRRLPSRGAVRTSHIEAHRRTQAIVSRRTHQTRWSNRWAARNLNVRSPPHSCHSDPQISRLKPDVWSGLKFIHAARRRLPLPLIQLRYPSPTGRRAASTRPVMNICPRSARTAATPPGSVQKFFHRFTLTLARVAIAGFLPRRCSATSCITMRQVVFAWFTVDLPLAPDSGLGTMGSGPVVGGTHNT